MATYNNLYLDISAYSGYNALTRDPEFTRGFVQRHWRKMLLGTDIVFANAQLLILTWLRELDVSDKVRQAIADGNARRLLRL